MKSKKTKKQIKEFNMIRGNIIANAIEIEDRLTFRLGSYFYPKSSQKSADFFWRILNTHKFSFYDKIELFKDISYFKKLKKYKQIARSLAFVKKIRNVVAHWELLESKSTSGSWILQSPRTAEDFKLNNKKIRKFEEETKFLISTL